MIHGLGLLLFLGVYVLSESFGVQRASARPSFKGVGDLRSNSRKMMMVYTDLELLSVLPRVLGPGIETSSSGSTSLLSLSFEELTEYLGGSGRAKLFWKLLRDGRDPLGEHGNEGLSIKVRENIRQRCEQESEDALLSTEVGDVSVSECGTRKFLQKCRRDDGEIESVLIPSGKFDRTTLCVSTQIGCDRACRFCLTGKMGFIRNLAADEIISQVILGRKIVQENGMPELTNVVFMGQGDAGRNIVEVRRAVEALVDRKRLGMSASKVTVSSVGPSPETFMELAKLQGTLAWSLHSPNDAVRKALVPSTMHTTVELRDGLIKALKTRQTIRTRTMMVACTLIDGVNDSADDARDLATFIRPMFEVAPKVALDLIPYNDIKVEGVSFAPPSAERIKAFTDVLREEGMFCCVRMPRGREEFSACGMLATTSKRKRTGAAVNNQ